MTGGVTHSPNTTVQPVSVTMGGAAATVQYEGSAPGDVAGVLQVNAVVPQTVSQGGQPVVMTIGGLSSQAGVTIAVK